MLFPAGLSVLSDTRKASCQTGCRHASLAMSDIPPGADTWHHPACATSLWPASSRYVSKEELLSQSDFVSLHCPLLPSTFHIIDGTRCALPHHPSLPGLSRRVHSLKLPFLFEKKQKKPVMGIHATCYHYPIDHAGRQIAVSIDNRNEHCAPENTRWKQLAKQLPRTFKKFELCQRYAAASAHALLSPHRSVRLQLATVWGLFGGCLYDTMVNDLFRRRPAVLSIACKWWSSRAQHQQHEGGGHGDQLRQRGPGGHGSAD